MWDTSLELRLPIARQVIWWVWFFDMVAAWPELRSMGETTGNNFYFSTGMGFRFTIPGFPIRLYFAHSFKPQDGQIVDGPADFHWGRLGLKFVIAFGVPGSF